MSCSELEHMPPSLLELQYSWKVYEAAPHPLDPSHLTALTKLVTGEAYVTASQICQYVVNVRQLLRVAVLAGKFMPVTVSAGADQNIVVLAWHGTMCMQTCKHCTAKTAQL
jgi:hypothetical protein